MAPATTYSDTRAGPAKRKPEDADVMRFAYFAHAGHELDSEVEAGIRYWINNITIDEASYSLTVALKEA